MAQGIFAIIFKGIDMVTPTTNRIQGSMNKINDAVAGVSDRFNNMGKFAKDGTTQVRHFNMNLLSTMFFGMAIQRAFLGLIQPALEAFGIFEMWGAMLTVLFIPTMELILPFFIQMIEFFMNLSTPIQQAIGVFAILGAALGTGMMIFGQFGLGIVGVGAILGTLAAPILIIVAALALLGVAYATNFGGFRDAVDNTWKAIAPILEGLWKVIVKVGEILWTAINLYIVPSLNLWLAVARMVIDPILGLFKGIIKGIFGVETTWTSVWDSIVGAIQWAWDIVKPILEAIKGATDWVTGGIKDATNAVSGLAEGAGSLISSGAQTVAGWVGGAAKVLGFAEGGIVPGPMGSPVPAIVHGGETIIPAGGGMGTNITINIERVSSDIDIEHMATEIERRVERSLSSMMR